MSKRKFYRTVVKIEVLSEDPLSEELTMGDLEYEITEGDCSGRIIAEAQNEVLTGKECADILIKQGSSTEFFMLEEDGKDID